MNGNFSNESTLLNVSTIIKMQSQSQNVLGELLIYIIIVMTTSTTYIIVC